MSVLVLGAGMMSGCVLEYLHRHNFSFSVVSCVERELVTVRGRYPDVSCHCLDLADPQLPLLISQHQLVINLFPSTLLAQVAEMCVDKGHPMLCPIQVSEELMKLHQRAVDAGVLLMCECGLDPGIDHMLAMMVIDRVIADGAQVTSFTSWCGGIPAPECRNNPLQYKFSWNPRGTLETYCCDSGYYTCNGETVVVPGTQIVDTVYTVDTTSLLPEVVLEGHANKSSSHHLKAYGLETIQNFFRGTLRYQGFCEAVKGLLQAGYFNKHTLPLLQSDAPPLTWKSLTSHLVIGSLDSENMEEKLLAKLDNKPTRVATLRGLGLLSETAVDKRGTPFDTLAALLLPTLVYGPGERDMIIMQHDIQYQRAEGEKMAERVGLVVYGDPVPGHSAMAKTVGYTLGIVARMVLKGEITKTGVVLPTTSDIYQPVLSALQDMGISAQFTKHTC